MRRRVHLLALRVASGRIHAEHVAGVGHHNLAELVGARRGIDEAALDVRARGALRAVLPDLPAGLVSEAGLAAGHVGLLGLPLLLGALGDHRVDGGKPVGPAHRIDRAIDQGLLLGLRRRAGEQEQC